MLGKQFRQPSKRSTGLSSQHSCHGFTVPCFMQESPLFCLSFTPGSSYSTPLRNSAFTLPCSSFSPNLFHLVFPMHFSVHDLITNFLNHLEFCPFPLVSLGWVSSLPFSRWFNQNLKKGASQMKFFGVWSVGWGRVKMETKLGLWQGAEGWHGQEGKTSNTCTSAGCCGSLLLISGYFKLVPCSPLSL